MGEDLASMKAQVYKDPRPAEHFTRFHERVRRRRPDPMYEVVRIILSPLIWTLWRGRCIASDNIPVSGPVILAPNHFSFLDHFFLAAFIRRKVQFMAKSQLFKAPLQFVYTHGGVFPVRRGHHDEEAFITAETILARGGMVAMYCEGGRSRTGKISDHAKPGIGRLVLESGAKVVPVAIFGTQRARNWKRFQFPKVTVQYGEPISFEPVADPTREQQQAVADEVLAAIKADARIRLVPVVMLTSSRSADDVIESYRRGANGYVVKPMDFSLFDQAIRSLCLYWLQLNALPRVASAMEAHPPTGLQDQARGT